MVKVSIACLIYKSTRWLQFVYDQVRRYTDLTDNEFYFVANDACEPVLNYLKEHNIPHYIHNNSEEQRKEWYINNVYRAWNTAGKTAKGEYVVFINSDMAFSEGWLDRLLEAIKPDTMVCSRLVERGIMRSGQYGIERNFGNVPGDYKEEEFKYFTTRVAENRVEPGGLYMPMLIKKQHLEAINYYPEGNVVQGSDIWQPIIATQRDPLIPGDKIFVQRLATIGVQHTTNFASIVYHFQEGELRDTVG